MSWLKYLLFFVTATSIAQIPLTGRVVDEASILSALQKTKLENLLAKHEKSTSNQIVILTVPDLKGQSIEEFGYQQARQWGLGTSKKNNGVLLIVALNDRQVRIEVGYGLEEFLTDANSKIIIERNILPYFRQGQIDQGILQGTYAILKILSPDLNASTNNEENEQDGSTDSWNIILLLSFIAFIIVISRFLGGGRRHGPRPPFMGSGFGQGNSGGFSGGGGSFGGGGASGRW